MALSQNDLKIISTGVIVAVIIVSMAGVIVYDESLNDDNGSESVYNILARVNTEGSGIYISESDVTGTINQTVKFDGDSDSSTVSVPARNGTPYYSVNTDHSYSVSEDNAAAWGGLIAGTPGSTSIQHVQLKSLVESMGLNFVLYEDGTTLSSGSVYYINTIVNTDRVINSQPTLDLGILWEPQYSNIITVDIGYQGLGLTNNFFPGHTCCILAGYTSYVSSHSDAALRFLMAYIEAVDWVNEAKDNSSENYSTLVNYGEELTSMSESVVADALQNITYVYGDSISDGISDLHLLKQDVASIVDSNSSSLQHNMRDLGFSNSIQFANRFVDDSYLVQATTSGTAIGSASASFTVAAISGDIHQIALKVAEEQGLFAKYGLNVHIEYASNGAGVAVALQNGSAQFGFLGAPPATITAVNSELITV